MTTFALVHGGLHGGWCWEMVVPRLEALGHRAVAPDLPIEDEAAGSMAWAETVAVALGDDTDVIAVGHSMGGMALPALASIRPVRRMVFLGAMVPVPGRVYAEYLAEEPGAVTVDAGSAQAQSPNGIPPFETIRDWFYNDCDEATVRRVYERLRPQTARVFTERYPIDSWPDAPSTSIIMTEDRCVGNDWSRRVAKERLGTVALELPGSHSPFYSRPQELAEILAKL